MCLLGPLAEEIAFRGVLVRSLAAAWSPPRAIAAGALAFVVYHHSPYQIVTPLAFAAMTGLLVLRSRSLVPGLIAHVATNVYVTLHGYRAPEPVWTSIADHHAAFEAACALATFAAVWMAVRRDDQV